MNRGGESALERLCSYVWDPCCKNRARAAFEQLLRYGNDLVRGLAFGEDRFGHPLTKFAMRVETRETEVFHRRPAKFVEHVVDGLLARADGVYQVFQFLRLHRGQV